MSLPQSLPRKLWGLIKSIKTGIALIMVITTAVAADILLLMQRWSPPAAGLAGRTGTVYRHWWFQVLVCLLMLNLTACTAGNAYRRIKLGSRSLQLWASTLFHAGLAVILAGTLVTGHFRVLSTIKLIQGEPKQIPYRALTTAANSAGYPPDLSLTLVEQTASLVEQTAEQYFGPNSPRFYSTVQLSDGTNNFMWSRLAIQQEIFYRGLYLFPSSTGYAAKLTVTPPAGKPGTDRSPAGLTIPMETREYDDGTRLYTLGGYATDKLPFAVSFIFYPDLGSGGSSAGYINRSPVLGSPGLMISIAEPGGLPFQKVLRQGESLDYKGYRLTFEGGKPWTELTCVYDPGARPVFAGIIMSIAGMTVFFLAPARRALKNPCISENG